MFIIYLFYTEAFKVNEWSIIVRFISLVFKGTPDLEDKKRTFGNIFMEATVYTESVVAALSVYYSFFADGVLSDHHKYH